MCYVTGVNLRTLWHLDERSDSSRQEHVSPRLNAPNFFFRQVLSLQNALWQRRSEPVKALRFASTAARRSRGLDRTLLASADAASHEAGALNKRNLVVRQCFRSYEQNAPAGTASCQSPSAAVQIAMPPTQRRTGKMRRSGLAIFSPYQERTGGYEKPHSATQ